MSGLWRETITVVEKLAEDGNGVAQTRATTHEGAYSELTAAERRHAAGPVSANAGLAMLRPGGYGDMWEVKPGDSLVARGRTLSVTGVNAVMDPKTLELHHIEVECG